MTLQTIIRRPEKSYYVTVRIEYLAICDGDDCCAALLNEFEQWALTRQREIEKAQAHATEWARPGRIAAPLPDEWVYWTRDEIYRELFGLYGESRLDASLKKLLNWGYIERRKKPRDKFDHSYQYRFMTATVQVAVDSPQYQDYDAVISRQRVVKSKHRSRNITTLKESKVQGTESKEENKDSVAPKRRATTTPKVKAAPQPQLLDDDPAGYDEWIEWIGKTFAVGRNSSVARNIYNLFKARARAKGWGDFNIDHPVRLIDAKRWVSFEKREAEQRNGRAEFLIARPATIQAKFSHWWERQLAHAAAEQRRQALELEAVAL